MRNKRLHTGNCEQKKMENQRGIGWRKLKKQADDKIMRLKNIIGKAADLMQDGVFQMMLHQKGYDAIVCF